MPGIVLSLLAIGISLLSFYWSWQASRAMAKTEQNLREIERIRAERAEALTGGGRS
jgi:hypothetical protein